MSEDSNELREHINSLSDEELAAIVTVDRAHYRTDALAFAEAELRRRDQSAEGEEGDYEEEEEEGDYEEEDAAGEYEESVGAAAFFSERGETSAEASQEEAAVWGEGEFWNQGAPTGAPAGAPRHGVEFMVFRSSYISWEELFRQAADFATQIGPERVISISHSADRGDGVVTVWFRS